MGVRSISAMMNPEDEKAIRQGIAVVERQMAEISDKLAEMEQLRKHLALLEAYVVRAGRSWARFRASSEDLPGRLHH